jgi:hypothetical protein
MRYRSFIFYDSEGVIYRHVSGSSEVFEGPGILEVTDWPQQDFFKCYITPAGDIAVRPEMPLVITQNPFTVTGIPEGTVVTYPDGVITVDDGFIEWSAVEPGHYRFHFSKSLYLEREVYAQIT